MTKFKLPVIIFFVGLTAFAQQKKWSLRECVDYALEHNISVKQAQLDTKIAEEDIISAKGNFLPSLNGSASQSYNFGSFIDNNGGRVSIDSRGNSFSLGTGIAIFNGFQNTYLYQQSKLGRETSQLQLDILKDDISLNVVSTYLNILFNKENLIIFKEQVSFSEKQVDQIEALVESGVRPRADLLDAQSQLASDVERLVNSQNSLDMLLLSLSQLLRIPNEGFDVKELLFEMPEAVFPYRNASEIYETALTNRPEIKNAELNVTSSELNIKLSKSPYYPSLNFSAGMGTSYQHRQGQADERAIFNNNGTPANPDDDFLEFVPNGFSQQLEDNLGYNFSFNLSIPIFNRFKTKTSVAKARINNEKSLLRLEAEKQTLQTNVEQAFADAKAALNQYKASQSSILAQKEAFKNAETSYNLGAMTSFDLEQVRNRLVNAQASLVNAKYNFVFKTKVLDFYLGKPLTE